MGQYWTLLNLDKRQRCGYLGKLGECLFNGTPERLVDYLFVPAAPIDDDPYFTKSLGCWAGDRIICIGDNNDPDNYPAGLLTDDELDEVDEYGSLADVPDYISAPRAHNLDLDQEDDSLWVLRNLSKREYVRADGIRPNARGPRFVRPAFGEIVMSRISWSSDGSCSMRYDGGIEHGVWAGDRFDIRNIDSVSEGEWKDVSDEVAKEISAIWESEYRSEWKGLIAE